MKFESIGYLFMPLRTFFQQPPLKHEMLESLLVTSKNSSTFTYCGSFGGMKVIIKGLNVGHAKWEMWDLGGVRV